MYNETISFRPRNGLSAQAYWEIRQWCDINGFTFSDVFNSVLIPLAYYLNNFCELDEEKNLATIAFNVGDLKICHVWGSGGKMYPLLKDKVDARKRAFTADELETRIAFWKKINAEKVEPYDAILLEITEA